MDEPIDKAELEEITAEFITETFDLIDAATRDLVSFESDSSNQTINSIFRSVHTIKGTSGFLGFNILSNLAHKTEDVLGKVRKGDVKPTVDIVNAILRSLDGMRLLMEDIKNGFGEKRETTLLLADLENVTRKDQEIAADSLAGYDTASDTGKECGTAREKNRPEKPGTGKDTSLSPLHSLKEQTVRVDIKKLDELMNLVSELVLGKNRLLLLNNLLQRNESINPITEMDIQQHAPANPLLASLAEGAHHIEVITNNLQAAVMKARLVPISRLFNKVPRLIRDLCTQSGKEVELVIEGESTELDKSLVEALYDPLTHIMRNSVDHGIEPPAERTSNGKSAKGVVSLKARTEGNQVAIEIFDDGKGIDLRAIKEKALAKGLLRPGDEDNLTLEQTMNYIFTPGFSTANKVTAISGRGVGMDVVKTNVEKMNGQVYVNSQIGKWTRLTIILPLTLAIMKALLVSVDEEFYAVPLDVVLEIIKPTREQIKTIQGNEVLMLRDDIIPLVRLSRVVGKASAISDACSIILCKTPERPIGLTVGSVAGQEEVVIKSLGEFLKSVQWIAGATIRGDGKIVLLLDLPGIFSHFCRQPQAA